MDGIADSTSDLVYNNWDRDIDIGVPSTNLLADLDNHDDQTNTSTEIESVDLCSTGIDALETSDSSNGCEVGIEETDGNNNVNPEILNIPVPEPHLGQEFDDEEGAYNYYNMYAKEIGFSVRKGRVERSRVNKRTLSRTFVCSNEGSKYNNDKRRRGINYQPRVSKKTNCGAALRIKPRDGIWVVDIFVKEHNHELVEPSQAFRLRSHQKTSKATIELIDRLQRCGISPTQVYTILKDFAGGEQHAGISDVRFRSMFRSKRKKSLGVDCQMAINYLETKRESDPKFYYSISVSMDGELTGIFWVDGRAREQYTKFGDVIVFDTTYRKNKYRFPFAPFTGVNHHRQCILFGCGLIADETKESFEWLFTTWLQSMQSVHPTSIITDEDPGILRAVKKVFPNTVHRLCAWHLEKHRMSHMGPLYRKYPDLRQVFHTCVRAVTITEFEVGWENMLNMYNLHNNKWLRKKYKKRRLWVPCYFPDTFFAGMSTTQRSESMNHFFKGYFSSSTPMNEFITQYEEALTKRREMETKEDVKCLTSKPPCCTDHPLEKQAAELYTENVFKIFKEEWKLCLGVEIRHCVREPPETTYETLSMDIRHQQKLHMVIDNVESDVTMCTCKMFEHTGVLCKHILKVYVVTDRGNIPSRYILPRWTKSSRFAGSSTFAIERSSTSTPQQPIWVLRDMAHRLVAEGTLSSERYALAYHCIANALEEVLKLEVSTHPCTTNIGQTSTVVDEVMIGPRAIDPTQRSITRGRPVQARFTGFGDNIRTKRSYHCSSCGLTGHNVAKCPKVDATGEASNRVSRPSTQIDLNDAPPV